MYKVRLGDLSDVYDWPSTCDIAIRACRKHAGRPNTLKRSDLGTRDLGCWQPRINITSKIAITCKCHPKRHIQDGDGVDGVAMRVSSTRAEHSSVFNSSRNGKAIKRGSDDLPQALQRIFPLGSRLHSGLSAVWQFVHGPRAGASTFDVVEGDGEGAFDSSPPADQTRYHQQHSPDHQKAPIARLTVGVLVF